MSPVTRGILSRVFFIKAAKYGTAFTLDVGGEEYLVTARHLFDLAVDNREVLLFRNKQWMPHELRGLIFSRSEADIAVMRLQQRLTHADFVVNPTTQGMVLGQDIYILGFPHLMHTDVGDLLGGNPAPLVKRGTASNIGGGDPEVFYVDTLSNVGFSGGPLVFSAPSSPGDVRIAGVISGFKTYHEPVIGKDGKPTGDIVELNTGLLMAYGIKHALGLIERMPK
ncbi:trypsin-like peptidase domain-containing protein [Dyella marensis]|uniref:S1 family peptidase n=1 Tax=Dyella marensis TaxID=500610 RepID=UPI0031D22948